MKTPVALDIANDNGKPEDHLAAITVALRRAMEGLRAPPKLIDALAVKPPVGATQP
ncbi:hypothetical protein [Mesorhizobium sp. NZP2077]|uniref:hypothetical protein n=1 Tax=Mesorhizobium sp. NZP2077 TaxID=2483404 RepID=UPI001AEF0541|nr:hypothetical protein [Mesorhizobium sp. NZP2077]